MRSTAAVLAVALAFPAFGATAKRLDNPDANRPRIAAKEGLAVTLGVKDEDVHKILKSMQTQCGIKNLAIDPDVQGKGTFYFADLPCADAFDVVFRSLRLKAVTYSNSLAAVESRH